MENQNKIIIHFVKTRSLFDRVIQFITWAKYSHVAMTLPSGVCWQSSPFKGVYDSKFKGKKNGFDNYEITVTDLELQKITEFCQAQDGKGYDWTGVSRFVFRQSMDDWGRSRWFCSEFVFSAFKHAGIRLLNLRAAKVDPGALATSPLLVKTRATKLKFT